MLQMSDGSFVMYRINIFHTYVELLLCTVVKSNLFLKFQFVSNDRGTFTTCVSSYLIFLANVNSRSRSLYAIARPSVCLSSVTLVHPTQPVEIFGNLSSLYDSPGTLVFDAKIRWWGRLFPLKFALKVTHPPFEHNDFDQYRLIVPQP